ncbi:MAG: hypothetical protein [Bacteriophage sp.]|nr:MAG: hypothetical protein [Bacteriophage sp.]
MYQFKEFIHTDLKLNPNHKDVIEKYHYINPDNYECVSGVVLSEFIFASDKLRQQYHFFKKVESRVR